MSVQTEINSRAAKLQAILDDANTAITAKNGTAAASLSGLPKAIDTITTGDSKLQTKLITPTGKVFTVGPDSDYDGLSAVTIAGDQDLIPENVAEGVEIYGVLGTHKGSTIPEPYAGYIEEAKAVYTGEYVNVIYAEGYGEQTGVTYKTVMFLLNNWTISAYDAATTGYTHSGFIMVQKEDDGAWEMTDYSNTTTDTHYAKNIKAASCYIEYNGMTLFPVGINSYPDVVGIEASNFFNGSFSETLETGDTLTYATEFPKDNQIKITAPDGTVTWVELGGES